jgi:hypothetical protein
MSWAARPTGMWWGLARFAAWAWASGPYCARPVMPAGGRRELRVLGLNDLAQPDVGGAQRGHQRGEVLPGRLGRQIRDKPP